mgnify:CR=1 FL=1
MAKYGLVIDITRCDGCGSCLLSVKDEYVGNNYPGYSAPQPVNGQKAVTGTLVGYDNGDVTLDLGDGPVTFAKKDVAQVRLHVGF